MSETECAGCGIRHYGDPCPYVPARCDECTRIHAPADECQIYCDGCGEWVADGHDCPYVYCEQCDDYVYDPHYHDDDCCCESPQQQFSIRNDGHAPLANDAHATITLPAGIISHAGIRAIRQYLANAGHNNISYGIYEIGDEWQNRNGNFTKRLSRYAYQTHQEKLTAETMSRIGNIARDHSQAIDVEMEVTRDLNQSAAYFYHEGSCYWGGYYESRCALKTNGAFGIRSFSGPCKQVSGRVWAMPMRLRDDTLTPTFDTMTPDAFIVFNGYGDLSGYAGARIMAHMYGWTYRKIGFDCEPMYINAGGYLVAAEHIAEPYTDSSIRLSVDQHSTLYQEETL